MKLILFLLVNQRGLNSKSVVMVKKLYRIKEKEIIKKIAKVPMQTVYNCLSLIEQVKKK